jgi:Zn finger protein HypA/HybF involved in hydrogenase expression
MMLVKMVEGSSSELLCRQCLRQFTLILRKTHHAEDAVQHCPFCRSSRVVSVAEGEETREAMRQQAEEAARRGFTS